MTSSTPAEPARYNPRYVCWLASRGETPETFVGRDKDENGDIVRIQDGPHLLPWTIVCRQWIASCWREWTASLGYPTAGLTPWEVPLRNGHTADEFDAWMRAKVGLS